LLAEGWLALGKREQARIALREVLEVAELGYRHLEGLAHRLLGEAYLGEDDAAAGRHLETASAILEDVGAQSESAKVLVAQADLDARLGARDRARQRLMRAREIFERLGTLDGLARVRSLGGAVDS
jgi:hypothetical protein